MTMRQLLTRGVVSLALAGSVLSMAGTAQAATTTSPEGGAATSCTSNYHSGVQSVDMTIQNDTGQVLTLDSANTGRADIGHWGARPVDTLQPGQCEELTGYSDSPVGDFYLTATYRLPDGTYLPFSVDSGSDSYNGVVFTNSGMSGVATGDLSGQQDFDWSITNPTHSGSMHVHYTLDAAPAASSARHHVDAPGVMG